MDLNFGVLRAFLSAAIFLVKAVLRLLRRERLAKTSDTIVKSLD